MTLAEGCAEAYSMVERGAKSGGVGTDLILLLLFVQQTALAVPHSNVKMYECMCGVIYSITPNRIEMGVEVIPISNGDQSTFPKTGQVAVVHYTGTLDNGTVFDSSRTREKPFRFTVGRGEVIRGWDESVAQMSVGQRAKLVCSSDYAYGSRGHPGVIPPNATLTFDVELLRVE